MYRDQVIAILRAHESELRAAGIEHLRLFGSVARGDETSRSDVDLALDLYPDAKLGFALGGIQLDLSGWLSTEVDIALMRSIRPALRERIERESVLAF